VWPLHAVNGDREHSSSVRCKSTELLHVPEAWRASPEWMATLREESGVVAGTRSAVIPVRPGSVG